MLQRVKYNFLSRGRVKRRVNYEQSTLGRGDKTGRVSLGEGIIRLRRKFTSRCVLEYACCKLIKTRYVNDIECK